MKSQHYSSISKMLSRQTVEYIEEQFDTFEEGELLLMCVELKNNQKLLCFISLDDVNVLYLPIHLVDYVTESGKLSYAFYPYQYLADPSSEVILNEPPATMFAPNEQFIELFFEYWESQVENHLKILNDVNTNDFVQTSIKYS